ncbi:TPA: esterase-like activity of phytase family protein [Pseudomonas aeruginosa]|nr:esterase-like activity of phytase family protein [Pseudomonas aeruginosa]
MHSSVPLTAALMAFALLAAAPQATAGASVPAPSAARSDPARFTFAATARVGDIHLTELSGLAWDEDEKRLYAVSDTGHLFHFRLRLDGDAIAAIEPISAVALADPQGIGAKAGEFNAEGLTLRNATNGVPGDSELVVALEGKPSRLARFGTDGRLLGELEVPSPAADLSLYRKKGRGLEALAIHPDYGLLTAPEAPLLGQPETLHTVYAKGRHWSFARQSPGSRLKALDVQADGELLVLERNKAGSKNALSASLRRVDLAACGLDDLCQADTLAVLPVGPDNFEGMTLLDSRHFLLVSDNASLVTRDTLFVLLVWP